jgi:spore germination cell wall hydrolase CwlJ-like protein
VRWLHGVFIALAAVWIVVGIAMVFVHAARPAEGAELRPGELSLLVRVVAAETTGEPASGQRAVAWTVINRLREPETYGKTITKVILRPYQYAKPAPLDETSIAYLRALLATVQALLGEGGDSSNGSTHFARCDLRPQPPWMRTFERRAVHGAHCFFRRRSRN